MLKIWYEPKKSITIKLNESEKLKVIIGLDFPPTCVQWLSVGEKNVDRQTNKQTLQNIGKLV